MEDQILEKYNKYRKVGQIFKWFVIFYAVVKRLAYYL